MTPSVIAGANYDDSILFATPHKNKSDLKLSKLLDEALMPEEAYDIPY